MTYNSIIHSRVPGSATNTPGATLRAESEVPSKCKSKLNWEVDWSKPGTTGSRVWARNPTSHLPSGREWHWITMGEARRIGIKTPTYRKDSWEIDWSRRDGKRVWGRNAQSKMPAAREWHWVEHGTLDVAGVQWRPLDRSNPNKISSHGYRILSRKDMDDCEIELCHHHGLWLGARKSFALEHRLIALKKYGSLPAGTVVRHINGDKLDNRPDNLVLGSTQDNTMDHNTARIQVMLLRERVRELERAVAARLEAA